MLDNVGILKTARFLFYGIACFRADAEAKTEENECQAIESCIPSLVHVVL